MQIYKKIMLWITRIGLYAIPFIPLYISRSLFFPYITGKAFIFRTIVEIVFFAWIFLAIFYEEYRPRRTPLLMAISFWVIIVSLATIFGVNPLKSFWSNFERMEGLITYLHLFAFFLVLSHTFRKQDWFIYLNLFLIAGLLENFYALFQKLGYLASPQGGTNRSDGTIGNPTYLAAYLLFILSFSLLLLIEAKNKALKYWYGVMSVFTLIIIYFTATRGATLALLGGAILATLTYLILIPHHSKKYYKTILFVLTALIVIPLGLWFYSDAPLVNNNPILSRLTSLSLRERTITSRFTIWSMGFEGAKERPILGWGPENFNVVFAKYYKPELWRQEPWFDRSHNIVLDWLNNAGVLGLISFLGILGSALYLIWRKYQEDLVGPMTTILLFITLMVYFAQNLFVFDNIATYIGLFSLFAFINSESKNEPSDTRKYQDNKQRDLYQPFVFCVFVIIAGGLLYFIIIQPLQTNLNLLEALKDQGSDPQTAYKYYDKALSGSFLGRSEVREQFIQYSLSVGSSNIDAEFKDKILRRAEKEATAYVADNALDPRSYLFLGSLYARLTSSDVKAQDQLTQKALDIFNGALKLSPKKQQIYFEIADVYIRKGDFVNAIKISKAAYDLDPEFNMAEMNLVASYVLNGQQGEADKILISRHGTVDIPDQILVQVYSRLLDMYRQKHDATNANIYAERLIRVWQAFIKSAPENVDYRKKLAIVYLVIGQPANAQKVLVEAVQSHPEFKSDIEAFIKQVQSGELRQ